MFNISSLGNNDNSYQNLLGDSSSLIKTDPIGGLALSSLDLGTKPFDSDGLLNLDSITQPTKQPLDNGVSAGNINPDPSALKQTDDSILSSSFLSSPLLDKLSGKTNPQPFSLFDVPSVNDSASTFGALTSQTSGSSMQSGISTKNAAQLSADRIFASNPQTPQEKAQAIKTANNTSISDDLIARGMPGAGGLKPIIPTGRAPGTSPGGGSPLPIPFFDNNSLVNSNSSNSIIESVIKASNRFDGDVTKTTEEALKSFPKTGNPEIDIAIATQVQNAVINRVYDEKEPGDIQAIRDAMGGRAAPINLKKIEKQVAEGQIPRNILSDDKCEFVENIGTGNKDTLDYKNDLIAKVNTTIQATPGSTDSIPVAVRVQQTVTKEEGTTAKSLAFKRGNRTYDIPTEPNQKYTKQYTEMTPGSWGTLDSETNVTPPSIMKYVKPVVEVGRRLTINDISTDPNNIINAVTTVNYKNDALHGKDGGSYCAFSDRNGVHVVPAITTKATPTYLTGIKTEKDLFEVPFVREVIGDWTYPPAFYDEHSVGPGHRPDWWRQ